MASEYFNYLARNEKPEEPRPPMTREQKIRNWFSYNWYWLIIGAVLLSITGSMLWNILGIGQVQPDYGFAYIGKEPLPEAQAAAFEKALSAYGSDVNGDGTVAVSLRQYATDRSGETETSLYYNYAADTRLLADITAGDSYFFLAEDPEAVQRAYQIFARADGSMPEETDYEAAGKVLPWAASPVLSALEVDQEVFGRLSLGRRYFVDDKADKHQADSAFWDMLTEGALQ